VRSSGEGGGRFYGEGESNKMVVRNRRGGTESAKVERDLVKARSSWFLALWVEGEGVSGRPN